MPTNPHFLFERELTKEEFNFWSTFFDHFPCHHNRYIQSFISTFAKQIPQKEEFNLETAYHALKNSQSNEEMIETLSRLNNWMPNVIDKYAKTIHALDKIIPNNKPIELFLFSIYSGFIQDWNLELSSKGISLINEGEISRKTHVPQLAMVADLMAGRLKDIFPTLDIAPISLKGETLLSNQKESYFFAHKKGIKNCYLSNPNYGSIIQRYFVINNEKKLEFNYDFSQNTDDQKSIYAPLQYEQNKLLVIIQNNYLNSSLKHQSEQVRRIKI